MNFLSSLSIKVFVLALLFSCAKTKDTAPDFGLDFLVEGLKGVVSISVNSSEPIAFNKDGLYPLRDNILHDHNFDVSIVSQPKEKYCDILPNKGKAIPGEKTIVKIYCQDNKITLKGLLIKQNIDVEGLEVSLSDSNVVPFSNDDGKESIEFEFPEPLDLFSDYEVKIKPPDNNQSCSVASDNGKGTVTNKLEKIIILCGSISYKMKGKITGEFQNSGIINLIVNNDYNVNVDLSQGQDFVVNEGNELISYGVNYEVRTIDAPSGYTCDTVSGKIDSSNFQSGVPVDIEIPCHKGKYEVKGEISGLTLGEKLSLVYDSGKDCSHSSKTLENLTNGPNTFIKDLSQGDSYCLFINTQPQHHTCKFRNNDTTQLSGQISNTDPKSIDNIDIVCEKNKYSLSGNIEALNSLPLPNTEVSLILNGDSNTIQNVQNPEQSSSFKFTEKLDFNEFYILTADRQSMNKGVICEDLKLGSMTGDLSDVKFKCYREQYDVSGTIRGLLEEEELALLVDSKEMAFKNGQHVFLSQKDYGVSYNIVLDQSKNENYTCNLNGDITGQLESSVTNIDIDCTPKKFSASGSISGAPPNAKIVVTISSTATSKSETVDLSSGNLNFVIQDVLSYGSPYLVVAKPEDQSSKVTCLSFQGDKKVTGDVTDIKVQCETSDFSVTGGVSGLLSSDKVSLTGASEDNYGIGPHVFIANKAPGTQYHIQVDKAHNTFYDCEVEGHNSGTLLSNVNDVAINCEPKKFSLSGNINGAPNTGTLNIKVDSASHQVTQDLDLSSRPTKYSLSQALTYGSYYTVEASISGEPLVLCQISKRDEKVVKNVNDAHINCQIKSLNVKGTVLGLLGNDNVILSGTDSRDGHFENGFHTFISSQDSKATQYHISITPDANANYDCKIEGNYEGKLQSNVDDIVITCTPKMFSISGTISIALTKGVLLLKISDGRQTAKEIQIDLSNSDRSYLEKNSLTYGSYYSVFASVKNNPFVSCSPLSSNNPVEENVDGANIECSVSSYNVTGGVYGLIDKDTVSLTGADLTEYGNGNHVFKSGSYDETFDIGIESSGNSYYACQVNNQNTVHITVQNPFLNIECTPNKYDISGKITGLPKSKSIPIRISFGSDESEFVENSSQSGEVSYSKNSLIPYGLVVTVSVSIQDNPSVVCQTYSSLNKVTGNIDNANIVCNTRVYQVSGYIDGLVEGDKINLKLSNTDESQYGNGGHVFKNDLAYKDPYNIGLKLPVNSNYECAPQGNYVGDMTNDILDANFHCECKTSRDKINLNVNKGTSVQIVFNDPACNYKSEETLSRKNNQIKTTVFSGHDFILEIKGSTGCNFETSGNKVLRGSISNSLQTININCN